MFVSACLDYEAYIDICPNCGHNKELVESSGWCVACTKAHSLCIDCGAEIPPNHQRVLCWDCKEERWLVATVAPVKATTVMASMAATPFRISTS